MNTFEEDAQHLKWLVIGHYVYSGLVALWSTFGLFFVFMGMNLSSFQQSPGNRPPPPMVGFMFVAIGVLVTAMMLGMAVAIFLAARSLARRKHHLLCLIVAGVDCMWFPLWTALGAFSFAVLLRPSVKAMFDAAPPPFAGAVGAEPPH